jgi:hypothetical protein
MGTYTGASPKTIADTPIWTVQIVRPPRDYPALKADLLATGDRLAGLIIWVLTDWLRYWRDSTAAEPPVCLFCGFAFRRSKPAPRTFAVFATTPRIRRNIVLSAICRRCAKAPDAELMVGAAKEACAAARDNGHIIGFGNIGEPPENIH